MSTIVQLPVITWINGGEIRGVSSIRFEMDANSVARVCVEGIVFESDRLEHAAYIVRKNDILRFRTELIVSEFKVEPGAIEIFGDYAIQALNEGETSNLEEALSKCRLAS